MTGSLLTWKVHLGWGGLSTFTQTLLAVGEVGICPALLPPICFQVEGSTSSAVNAEVVENLWFWSRRVDVLWKGQTVAALRLGVVVTPPVSLKINHPRKNHLPARQTETSL